MRHGKKFNHLGRTASHRKAMMSNMACSLIEHKRIKTTLAKAKALRVYVEPILTRGKKDDTHQRRQAFKYLQNKNAVSELFGEIGSKIADRPGGYTRIIKLGFRQSDATEMAIIELVDYNEHMLKDAKPAKKKSRRGRKKKTTKKPDAEAKKAEATDVVEEAKDTATGAVEPTE